MTADEQAHIQAELADIRRQLDAMKAREPERLRLRIKSELALERLRQANAALREALPH